MKKFVAILLTLMLVLGVSGALAADTESVVIKKAYKLVGAGSSPAETFTLVQTGSEVTSGDATAAPALGAITGAAFDAGAATADDVTKPITVSLPNYDRVGIYEYTLKEVKGNTAGVGYYDAAMKLVVTVVNGENGLERVAAVHTELAQGADKSDTFENTYSAGTLTVKKTVTGNLGDKNKEFDFTVTFAAPEGKDWTPAITLPTGAGMVEDNPMSYTFKLKHDGTASFGNLPAGVTYTVTEAEVQGYTTTSAGDKGTIGAGLNEVTFTNDKHGEIPTGVTTENLPYVLLIGFVVLAGAALLIKRKAHNN
mgnify:CR=1 FL=1